MMANQHFFWELIDINQNLPAIRHGRIRWAEKVVPRLPASWRSISVFGKVRDFHQFLEPKIKTLIFENSEISKKKSRFFSILKIVWKLPEMFWSAFYMILWCYERFTTLRQWTAERFSKNHHLTTLVRAPNAPHNTTLETTENFRLFDKLWALDGSW